MKDTYSACYTRDLFQAFFSGWSQRVTHSGALLQMKGKPSQVSKFLEDTGLEKL